MARMPILPAVRALFPSQAESFALRGGEDYELLFTIPVDRFAALESRAGDLAATVTPIGRIAAHTGGDRLTLVLQNGDRIEGAEGAFDHFGD